jgi:hypothetical protein
VTVTERVTVTVSVRMTLREKGDSYREGDGDGKG